MALPVTDGEFDLKAVVRPIILAQGNQFIKELLRENKLKIGSTKSEFEKNLFEAIDDKTLTQEMVERWLLKIEGWGDQHVYLFDVPAVTQASLKATIEASEHRGLLDVSVSYAFPKVLSLTAIRLDAHKLSVDWHVGSGGWERAKSKDYQAEIDGDTYEFRAYRDRRDRAVVRFEWEFDRHYCSLFTQLPNEGEVHANTLKQVAADLKTLGVLAAPLAKVGLSRAVKAAGLDTSVVAHSTKMSTEGGYVDFVVTLSNGGIGDVEPIRQARQGVKDSDFGSAEGMLSFSKEKHPALTRTIKTTVYGSDGRFRVWVQCKRDDIYAVADLIWRHNA